MGNQELLDYFGEYAATKARHSYGPAGHRGISVLIFESSAVGYMEGNVCIGTLLRKVQTEIHGSSAGFHSFLVGKDNYMVS